MPRFVKKDVASQLNGGLTLRQFYERRNRVLVIRETGGAGDILMHRMMFEDFKRAMPQMELHFACPREYHDLVKDHPFVDRLLDSKTVNRHDYLVSYNTSAACGRYEAKIAPLADKHRSDIWAEHCGVKLERHNMHVRMKPEVLLKGQQYARQVNPDQTRPTVAIAPISAIPEKNLLTHQLAGLVEGIRARGGVPFGLHSEPVELLNQMNVPTLWNLKRDVWMGVVQAADYVVSVDTATFHMAGGLFRPVVGVFTFADGVVYGKYYPKFELVQKHRKNGDWDCGPCYTCHSCPKSADRIKPCLTEITPDMILAGYDRLLRRFPWDPTHGDRLGVINLPA
jgi:ADP-heptose:LPS heptosyltransferase